MGLLPNRLLLQILNFGCKLQTAPWRILAKYASSRFEIFARNLEFSSQSLLGRSPIINFVTQRQQAGKALKYLAQGKNAIF